MFICTRFFLKQHKKCGRVEKKKESENGYGGRDRGIPNDPQAGNGIWPFVRLNWFVCYAETCLSASVPHIITSNNVQSTV